MTRHLALVPCAGNGSRAGGLLPKQYAPLNGEPMVAHTLRALAQVGELSQILLVLSPDDAHWTGQGVSIPDRLHVYRGGGATRAASVCNGLKHLRARGADDRDWVLVHDAARCLVRPALVRRLIESLADDDVGGLLALPLPDTLKQAQDGRVNATLDRSDKWLAQTPQMFRLGLLERALAVAGTLVTDESSAVEALGHRPRLVASSADNFKVTFPEDFILAEAILRSREHAPTKEDLV